MSDEINITVKVCHYTNLQPLWAKDNLDKRAPDKLKYGL